MSVLVSRKWLPITILGVISALFYLLMQNYIAVVWYDEIGTSDTPINVVLYGKWDSEVWHYTYNPLHAFLLIPWLHIFGISHASVCNLNIILSLVTFLILEHWMITKSYITERRSGVMLILLLWMGFAISGLMTKGRIDMLGMLLSVIMSRVIFWGRASAGHFISLFVAGFLLMMANMYVIPLIAFLMIFLWVINYRMEGRLLWFGRGVTVALSFIASFLCICYFYYQHHFVLHFLSSFFTFTDGVSTSSSFFVRVLKAYLAEPVSLLLISLVWLSYFSSKCEKLDIRILAFVTAIPFLMCVAGRYQGYYVWLFSAPVLFIFTTTFDALSTGKLKKIMLVLVIAQSFLRPAYWIYMRPQEYRQRHDVEHFIRESSPIIEKYANVYFVNAICYYAFVDAKMKIFFLNNDNLKVEKGLIQTLSALSVFKNYEEDYPCGCLPDEGLAFNTSKDDELRSKKYLDENGFSYTLLKSNQQMSIYKFKRDI